MVGWTEGTVGRLERKETAPVGIEDACARELRDALVDAGRVLRRRHTVRVSADPMVILDEGTQSTQRVEGTGRETNVETRGIMKKAAEEGGGRRGQHVEGGGRRMAFGDGR